MLFSTRKAISIAVTLGFAALVAIPLYPLLSYADPAALNALIGDGYYQKIIVFTFFQAFAGSALSILLGVPAGWAFWRMNVRFGKLTAGFSLICFVLPSLIAAILVLRLYGNAGLFAPLIRALFPDFNGIYGFVGILPVYLFLNIPYVLLMTFTGLNQIPAEYLLLGDNMGLSGIKAFRTILLPRLKSYLFCAGAVIFGVCFTAFPVVMIMGGGPQYSIMEVEIYRLIRYEFSPESAVALAMIQLISLLPLNMFFTQFGKTVMETGDMRIPLKLTRPMSRWERITAGISLLPFFLLTVLPLTIGVLALINSDMFKILTRDYFLSALQTSLLVSLTAAVLSLAVAFGILILLRHFKLMDFGYANMIFFVSPIIFSTGLFILFRNVINFPGAAYFAVIVVNAFIVLPFVNGILRENIFGVDKKYRHLCQILNIGGLKRLWYIDLPAVSAALIKAFSMAACLSVGEFSVIAMFGSEDFGTLPFLINRLNGHYKTGEAGAATFWLFVLFILLFFIPHIISKLRKTDA